MTESVCLHKNGPHTKIKNKTKRNWRQRYVVIERNNFIIIKKVEENRTNIKQTVILQELLELASKFTLFKFHLNVMKKKN